MIYLLLRVMIMYACGFVLIKFLELLKGIDRIDIVKKIMLLDLDFIFIFNCGIAGICVG